MAAVPLGINAYKRSAAFTPEVRMRNLFLEEDKSGASPDNYMRIGRAGLTRLLELPYTTRGVHHQDGLFNGSTFFAAGSRLYQLNVSGGYDDIGSIGSGNRVIFTANYERLFLLSAFVPFTYDGTTLAGIVMPDARDVQDIDVLNNYIILACPDGRFYWIVPGQSTVDALDFETAESAPDGLVAVKRVGDEIVLFGSTSSEIWQTTGDSAKPFSRAAGRNFDRGCVSRDSVRRYDNSLIWVGNDSVVYRLGNVPQRISDHGIEQRLRDQTDLPSALVVEQDGHKFYVLRIAGQGSFGYDAATGQWCEFASDGATEWRPHDSSFYDSSWILGSYDSGHIWRYDPDALTDDGDVIERICTATAALMGLPGRQDSLSVGTGSSADFTLQIRWKDGQDDFPAFYEELEARAPADIVNLYRLGQPDQPFRHFEVRVTDEVALRISGARVNEA